MRWLRVLADAFGHEPFLLTAYRDDSVVGHLPLCCVRSLLFGRFLVSLPYLNSGGVHSESPDAMTALVDEAVRLADRLDVKFLELRHEEPIEHPAFTQQMSDKVHMRLPLPDSADAMMDSLKSKRRSQLKNGLKRGFCAEWGGMELLDAFYAVFSRNMRDLGTPVYGRKLFRSILQQLGDDAEFCCLRDGDKPVAAALLLHERGVSEVPSASSLREYNSTNVNMAMYWHLLERAIERGSRMFDFGRSTVDGPTYRFKKQWGAEPSQAVWQYYVRRGEINAARPENKKFGLAVKVWKRLPLAVANRIGPPIVRGIP
ncbi:FemAB family XrtA/PEP-CTERM system-associated protein [Thalassoroseus pseudoceratinae]|uniref:FemAB family XrtA/PEP-CTERM system-associated protein n=1 Tax=Thalassoroseus pseudoceratinae TaxID=2713176 RepID=UPI00141FAC40|nr:FemAB family XrtA/PEP-CTERM system-associated protein [Thalassoroseus pseudoceratinae]